MLYESLCKSLLAVDKFGSWLQVSVVISKLQQLLLKRSNFVMLLTFSAIFHQSRDNFIASFLKVQRFGNGIVKTC